MSDTNSTTTMDDTLRYELLESNGPKGAPTGDPVMSVRNLRVSFNTEAGVVHAVRDVSFTEAGVVHAVRDVSFDLWGGRTLGIVGESGSGKSVTALSLIGLLDDNAHVTGSVKLNGEELIGKSDEEMSKIRGARISMIFQDPLSALTPMFSIGSLPRRFSSTIPRCPRTRCASAASSCSPWWASPIPRTAWTHTRTSSPVACASAW